MYKHILLPIDLARVDQWSKAIETAVDLARHWQSRITLVSVAGGLDAEISHSAQVYEEKLKTFAAEQSEARGLDFGTLVYNVPDRGAEVDQTLLQAVSDSGADLVIMATHQPGWLEYLVNSHGGRLASHAPISVFVVRDT